MQKTLLIAGVFLTLWAGIGSVLADPFAPHPSTMDVQGRSSSSPTPPPQVSSASVRPMGSGRVDSVISTTEEVLPHRASTSCLAKEIYYEARGEAPAGMVAVGAVALNRVHAEGATPCDVVFAKAHGRCQFSWACSDVKPPSGPGWYRSLTIATALLSPRGIPDPSKGAEYFSRCGSRLGRDLEQTARIGHQCFWRPPSDTASLATQPARFELIADEQGMYGWHLSVAQGI